MGLLLSISDEILPLSKIFGNIGQLSHMLHMRYLVQREIYENTLQFYLNVWCYALYLLHKHINSHESRFNLFGLLKSLRSEHQYPVFIFLIEALGPISCKNLNKFSKNVPKTYFSQPFLDLATLHIPYVTNTPANRCHGKVNYVF